ncbi:hypothetical protein [Streptomyces sp. NPDC127197]|uniref:hypothetical protein n=1 Tax=Streptomyces sp. NPDC127197 TaxID=3345388 RepID=UPI00362DBE01
MIGKARRVIRHTAASCAALVLLAGCGGNAGEAKTLDAQQNRATLPDAKVAPGWKVTIDPVAYPLGKAKEFGVARCYEGPEECSKVQFVGVSGLHDHNKPTVDFTLLTYPDSAAAQSAYEPVWKAWSSRIPEARALNLGEIGDQNDAVSGLSASLEKGSQGLISQVRVESVIMLTTGRAGSGIEMQNTLKKFVTVFAERAEQALQGKTPSFTLDDVA